MPQATLRVSRNGRFGAHMSAMTRSGTTRAGEPALPFAAHALPARGAGEAFQKTRSALGIEAKPGRCPLSCRDRRGDPVLISGRSPRRNSVFVQGSDLC